MAYEQLPKEKRRQWWNSLTQAEQAAYTRKKAREATDEEDSLEPLTDAQIRRINGTMRRLGLEQHIVLRDPAPSEADDARDREELESLVTDWQMDKDDITHLTLIEYLSLSYNDALLAQAEDTIRRLYPHMFG